MSAGLPTAESEGPRPPHRKAGASRSNAVLFAFALAFMDIAVVVSAGYYYVIRSSEERARAALTAAEADTTNRCERQRAELHRKASSLNGDPISSSPAIPA